MFEINCILLQATQPDTFWMEKLFVPAIAGLVLLAGQFFIQPIIARHSKRHETILAERYKACMIAIEVLQKRLAANVWTGPAVPIGYVPQGAPPTQLEINMAYCRLAIFANHKLAQVFLEFAGNNNISVQNIGFIIKQMREDLGVDGESITPNIFGYIFAPNSAAPNATSQAGTV